MSIDWLYQLLKGLLKDRTSKCIGGFVNDIHSEEKGMNLTDEQFSGLYLHSDLLLFGYTLIHVKSKDKCLVQIQGEGLASSS
jgi:hypothetical protein